MTMRTTTILRADLMMRSVYTLRANVVMRTRMLLRTIQGRMLCQV